MATTTPLISASSPQMKLLNVASPLVIEDTLRRMRYRYGRYKRWLTAKHQYSDVVREMRINLSSIDGFKLAEYIAASIPLHVADGWVFLARAFDSIRSGDRNNAINLAYYAELRAAMSLLASEGIGVFNNRHVAIGPKYTHSVWKGDGTHTATWKLLEAWANDHTRVATLLSAITVESRTINQWFDEAGIFRSVQHHVARRWLASWSIDLKNFEVDHDYRNHASYRPSRITPGSMKAIDASAEVVDPFLQTWDALEPSADVGGAAVDRVLLFGALRLAKPAKTRWEPFVDYLYSIGIASESLRSQLKELAANEHYLFKWAGDSSDPPPAQAVLARATLLLRIANGVCAQRLATAEVTKKKLQFWLTRFGEDSGLWSNETEPESFADLWEEVGYALGNVEEALESESPPRTMEKLTPILGRNVALTQFSRVPLWLLGVDDNVE